MIQIIDNQGKIDEYQRKLVKVININLEQKIECRIGFPGGSFEGTVNYSDKFDMWFAAVEVKNRYWNGFGLGKPSEVGSNSINGEINFSMNGINRRIAGVYGIDDDGIIIILHRGKVRLTKGKDKSFFRENFRGNEITAYEKGQKRNFYMVGELDSQFLIWQIRDFISEVQRIKNLAKKNLIVSSKIFPDFNYIDEKFGTSVTDKKRKKVINRTHGIIVNSLANMLEEAGYNVGNDKNRDLFIFKNDKVKSIFEIKTNSSTQSLYSAVGQLLVYSFAWNYSINLIAVLPHKLREEIERKLSRIGIQILYYRFENDKISFSNLAEIKN